MNNNFISFDDLITKIDPQKDYPIKEIVELLPVSYACVMNAIKREHIKSIKVFGKFWIRGEEIQKYLTSKAN